MQHKRPRQGSTGLTAAEMQNSTSAKMSRIREIMELKVARRRPDGKKRPRESVPRLNLPRFGVEFARPLCVFGSTLVKR